MLLPVWVRSHPSDAIVVVDEFIFARASPVSSMAQGLLALCRNRNVDDDGVESLMVSSCFFDPLHNSNIQNEHMT
jgi:hypothetical protein